MQIKFRKKSYEILDEIQLAKAIKRLGLNNLSVLAVRDGSLITEDEILHADDEIELIEVISGG